MAAHLSTKVQTISLVITLLLLPYIDAKSQQFQGRVVHAQSLAPIPFVHITLNEGELEMYSDAEGSFSVPGSIKFKTVRCEKDLYRSLYLASADLPKDGVIKLQVMALMDFEEATDKAIGDLMREIRNNKSELNAEKAGIPFEYSTYNKFSVSSGRVAQVKTNVNKALKFLRYESRIKDTVSSHHLLLVESITQRQYLDGFNQRETVDDARVSGIKRPSLFAINSQIQPFTLYDDLITLAGKSYFGPFMFGASQWFHFRAIDTVYLASDTLVTVKFSPKRTYRVDFLKGYLYVSLSHKALVAAEVYPANKFNTQIGFYQYYAPFQDQITGKLTWFPSMSYSSVQKNKFSNELPVISLLAKTQYYDVRFVQHYRKKDFDETIYNYQQQNLMAGETPWTFPRPTLLSPADSSTYTFYDSVGQLQNFENVIRIGEGLYYGELPFKYVNLDLSKVFTFNDFEGVRLGLGFRTNENIWGRGSFGTYIGYGFLDNILKHGHTVEFNALPDKLTLKASIINDLREMGSTRFHFEKKQFSNENVRNYRLLIWDKVKMGELVAEFHPIRYVMAFASLSRQNYEPLYAYVFDEHTTRSFNFVEVSFGARFAYGQQYLQSIYKKIPLRNPYPLMWVQVAKGYKGVMGGEYNYTKIDFKLQASQRFPGLGTSYIQWVAGMVHGLVPVSKLYSGMGSYRTFSAIAHSSFETMAYNEFLADKHIALFFTHNFGKILIRKYKKEPSLDFAHNMGWSSLSNPKSHNIPYKTMEKGFMESGIFMNNILVLKGLGIQAGLGAGVFARYGAYAFPTFSDNFLFKLAVDFQL